LDAGSLTVVLKNKPGGGEVRFPEPADTTTTLSLPADESWVPFEVSGQVASPSMGDAAIELRRDSASGQLLGERALTVLWVDLKGYTAGSVSLAPVYQFWGLLSVRDRGVHLLSYGGGVGWAKGMIEIQGEVWPPDFDVGSIPVNPEDNPFGPGGTGNRVTVDKGFVMERLLVRRRIYGDGIERVGDSADNQQDDSLIQDPAERFMDVWPSRESGKLLIADVDGPASGQLDGCADVRQRANFTEWVTFTYTVGGQRATVRCSDEAKWATRLRIADNGAGEPVRWETPGDSPNDGAGENEVIWGAHTNTNP